MVADEGAAVTQAIDNRDRRALACVRNIVLICDTDDEHARITQDFASSLSAFATRFTTYAGILVLMSSASSMKRETTPCCLAFQLR